VLIPVHSKGVTHLFHSTTKLNGRDYANGCPMAVTKADFNSKDSLEGGAADNESGEGGAADNESVSAEAVLEAVLTSSNIVVLRNIFDVSMAKTKAGYLEVRFADLFSFRVGGRLNSTAMTGGTSRHSSGVWKVGTREQARRSG
jgi:hypothetical protein